MDDDVAAVRAFGRFYTRILGLLSDGLLDTSYSLTEARILYELGQKESTDVVDLRRASGLDGGYLSRLLSRFARNGLVERERSAVDGRRQVVRLTTDGRAAFELLDRRSSQQVDGLLAGLDARQRRRLVGAMGAIESVLGEAPPPALVVLRPAGPGDLGWIVERHGLVYAREYGWDQSFEALVARIVAEFVEHQVRASGRVAAWMAEVDGEPVGCVLCVDKDETTAQLRLLLVDPRARGTGIGGRLIEECLRFARRAGYDRMVLWTNDVLVEARRLYEKAGFTLDTEGPHRAFGHDLVEQTWSRDL